jgi:hypothetical protein
MPTHFILRFLFSLQHSHGGPDRDSFPFLASMWMLLKGIIPPFWSVVTHGWSNFEAPPEKSTLAYPLAAQVLSQSHCWAQSCLVRSLAYNACDAATAACDAATAASYAPAACTAAAPVLLLLCCCSASVTAPLSSVAATAAASGGTTLARWCCVVAYMVCVFALVVARYCWSFIFRVVAG